MAFNKIARKSSDFRVVFTLPDFCWPPPPAPPQVPPLPFPLFADLGNAKTVAKDVRLNRKPAFVFKASKTNRTTGDEPAVSGRKGILSRTATKPAWPMMHSSSVKIRKRHIIRAGDMFHMNNKFKKKLPPKPCISCKAAAAAGRPVNPIHGLKFLEKETDFAFEGILQLVWSRSYYSDQDGTGWLGEGWSVPGCQRIIRDAAGLAYIDDQGRLFPLLEVDEDDEEPVLFESEQDLVQQKARTSSLPKCGCCRCRCWRVCPSSVNRSGSAVRWFATNTIAAVTWSASSAATATSNAASAIKTI